MHITNAQNDIERILLTEEQLHSRIKELAEQISVDYEGKRPIIVCILKGSSVFFAELCKYITCHMQMDFIDVSSYGNGTHSGGTVKFLKDLDNDIENRHVLLIEDIMDSGRTLHHLRHMLAGRSPASLKVCCLLNKPGAHPTEWDADYNGFQIGNEFVVGYGLDYAEYYRNLPYIGILSPKAYAD